MTLSIAIALRHWNEFALHVRAAKNNGLTDEEIAEALQHAALYTGAPAANHALTRIHGGSGLSTGQSR